MVFCPFGHVLDGDFGSEFCWFSTKICRDRSDFMSIGIIFMYSEILWRILLKRLYSLSVFSKK